MPDLKRVYPHICQVWHALAVQGVVNRDIKLENTLLDASPKPLVKITDFGYCKSDKESLPKSKVGTPGYTGAFAHPHPSSHLPE